MKVIWNDSLWFLESIDGMIIGNDTNIKYRISGNADYFKLCSLIKEKIASNEISLKELSEYLEDYLPPAVIKDVVTNLINLGLIIESAPNNQQIKHPLAEYLSSFHGGVEAAIKNFASNNVTIVGNGKLLDIFDSICSEYTLNNFNYYSVLDCKPEQEKLNEIFNFADMIIGVGDNIIETTILFPMLNKQAIENNKPLLIGSINGHNAHLGPLIIPGETACFNCMEIRKENNLPNLSDYQFLKTRINSINNAQVQIPSPLAQAYLCHSLLFDAIKYTAKVQMPPTYQHTNIYNTNKQKTESHYIVKVPLCDVCGAHSEKPFSKIWCM